MKPKILVLISVTITLAGLAIPDRLQVHGQSQRQLHYTVTDLGNLGGNSFDEGVDINNQGQVAGFSSLPGDTTFHAFLWTENNGYETSEHFPETSPAMPVASTAKAWWLALRTMRREIPVRSCGRAVS